MPTCSQRAPSQRRRTTPRPREEAEERYGDYLDLLEAAAEALADMRDRYARPLEEPLDDEYSAAFDRAAGRRYPRLATHLG